MKRFIDLRGQHTGHRFAWWCTVRDEFEMFYGDQAWSTWTEFAVAFVCNGNPMDLRRYMALAPAWALEPDPDDDFDADTVSPRSEP